MNSIELARRAMAALSGRNLAELIELSDDAVEWQSFFAVLGEQGTYRGHDGLRQYISDLSDAFDIVRADVDGAMSVGDVVVLVGRIHYRGHGSGLETEMPAGWMLKFRGEKVIRFRAFREPEKALETVGVSH